MPLRSLFFTATIAMTLWITACASPRGQELENAAPPFRDATMRVADADKAIIKGVSTKADVQAALGVANVVNFESNYEVWVYRSAGAEFVVLFPPNGIVKKTRIRQKPA
ncbi:MAG: hypothetical protein V4614_07050 [Pseudomonadota bacterium]